MMKIDVIGCGSAFSKISNTSSLLVEDNSGNQLLIDCGPTVPRALFNRKMGVNDIQSIFITHIHPDHCTGLAALFNYWKSFNRSEPVTIFCQKDHQKSLQFLTSFANWPSNELCFELSWHITTPRFLWKNWVLETADTQHEISNEALRICADGQHLFYSGDGRPTQRSIALMQDTDLAFQECSSFEALDKRSSHGDFLDCKALLNKTNTKRLGLFHCRDEDMTNIKHSAVGIDRLFVSHDRLTMDLSALDNNGEHLE